MKNIFRLLAKAMGTKEGNTDKEANVVAIIRLVILLQVIITNGCIIAGVIHQW